MTKLKRYGILLLALALTAGLLAGCSREEAMSFRVAMSSVPATLDPALASTDEEKTAAISVKPLPMGRRPIHLSSAPAPSGQMVPG